MDNRRISYYTDGTKRYDGEWENDKYHGFGTYYSDNKKIYEGEWQHGERHGRGIYYYDEIISYDGEWQNGKRNGKGIYYNNGLKFYEGDWQNDKYHGKGIYYRNDGIKFYEGDVQDDKRHGKGKLYFIIDNSNVIYNNCIYNNDKLVNEHNYIRCKLLKINYKNLNYNLFVELDVSVDDLKKLIFEEITKINKNELVICKEFEKNIQIIYNNKKLQNKQLQQLIFTDNLTVANLCDFFIFTIDNDIKKYFIFPHNTLFNVVINAIKRECKIKCNKFYNKNNSVVDPNKKLNELFNTQFNELIPDLNIDKKHKKGICQSKKRDVWYTYVGKEIGSSMCLCCKNEEITQINFHCGHIISEKDGGTLDIVNLRPICSKCNLSMGSENMNDFIIRNKYGNIIE